MSDSSPGLVAWLQILSTPATAVATVVLAIVTGVYVGLTRRLARAAETQIAESRRQKTLRYVSLDAVLEQILGMLEGSPSVQTNGSGKTEPARVSTLFRWVTSTEFWTENDLSVVRTMAPEFWSSTTALGELLRRLRWLTGTAGRARRDYERLPSEAEPNLVLGFPRADWSDHVRRASCLILELKAEMTAVYERELRPQPSEPTGRQPGAVSLPAVHADGRANCARGREAGGDAMGDLFTELYKLNEQYHDAKEQAIWVGATLYLSFVVGSALWLVANLKVWCDHRLPIAVFAITVLALVAWFVFLHNWNRVRSVKITAQLLQYLGSLTQPRDAHAELRSACEYPTTSTTRREKWRDYWKLGGLGNVVIVLAVLFGLAQAALILSFKK